MRLKVLGLLCLLIIVAILFALKPAEVTAPVMGTTVRVKVNGPLAFWHARQAVGEIKRLEKIFRPVTASPDTTRVLALAEAVKKASGGAFDICWSGTVDLGGIGKGYAVEAARQVLLKSGVKSAIIDMHSSIAVIGNGWKIGIQDPEGDESQKILRILTLNDGDALATSGQYEQPGHIVDPWTKKAADKCLSVTIVCKDAGLADALSTAVFVLGSKKGTALAKKMGAQVFIYDNFGTKLW